MPLIEGCAGNQGGSDKAEFLDMPVDPQIKQILDKIAGTPPRRQVPLRSLRESVNADVRQGPRVDRIVDEAVRIPGGSLSIRLYYPSQADRLPLILFLHGGAFCLGSITQSDALCRMLCLGSGAIVASLEYRLAPEFPFPAAVEDSLAALDWLVAAAPQLKGDAERIVIAGESAGGNLAAVTAIAARNRGGPALRGQMLINPATDAADGGHASMELFAQGFNLTRDDCRYFQSLYIQTPGAEHDPRFAVLRTLSLAGLPPTLILTAKYDPLRDEGEAFGERLSQAGVPVTAMRIAGAIHGFYAMPVRIAQCARTASYAWLQSRFG
jgi:acetyl esterase